MPYELDPNTNEWVWVGDEPPPPQPDQLEPERTLYFENVADWRESGEPAGTATTRVLIGERPPAGEEFARPPAEPETLVVGVRTEAREEISLTPEIKALKASTEAEDKRLFEILRTQGVESFNRAIAAERFAIQQETRRLEQQTRAFQIAYAQVAREQEQALGKVSRFVDAEGNLDVTGFLRANPNDTETLTKLGIDFRKVEVAKPKDIPPDIRIGETNFSELYKQYGGDSKDEATRKRALVLTGIVASQYNPELAYAAVPGLYVGANWGTLTTKEKAINIGIDAIYLLSLTGLRLPRIDTFTKVGQIATDAGDARRNLAVFSKQVAAGAVEDTPTTRAALQRLEQASRAADVKLIQTMEQTKNLDPQRIKAIEKLSGIKGISESMDDVQKATDNVARVRSEIDTLKYNPAARTAAEIAENNKYLQALERLQRMQGELNVALDRSAVILQPQVKPSQLPARQWLARLEDDVARARADYSRASSMLSQAQKTGLESKIEDARQQFKAINSVLTSVEDEWADARRMVAAGKRPPITEPRLEYKVTTKPEPDTKAFFKEVDDWLKDKGKYEPKTPVKPGAVAVKEQLDLRVPVKTKVELSPAFKRAAARPEPVVPSPKEIKPVPFRLPPKPKLEPRPSVTEERLGAMTPEQARRFREETREVVRVQSQRIEDALAKIRAFQRLTPQEWQTVKDALDSGIRAQAQARAAGLTSSQINANVKAAIAQATKAKIAPEARPQPKLAQQLRAVSRTILKTPLPDIPEVRRPIREVRRAVIPSPGATDEERREYIKASEGAIAWRMGKIGKKDRWDVIVHPYEDGAHYVMVLGKAPAGATVVKGTRSAYRTAQVLYGKGPRRTVRVDSGLQDISITPTDKKVALRFSPDPKGLTRGDITIGRPTPTISRKQPRISARAPRIS